MKSIVVYYSLNGNTKMVAEKVAEKLGCDICKITTKKKLPKGRFLSIVVGSLYNLLKARPAIRYDKNISGYDHVIICTPIWSGTFAAPIRSFVSLHDMREQKLSVIATYEVETKKCVQNLIDEVEPKEFIAKLELNKPASDPQLDNKIEDFVGTVKQ